VQEISLRADPFLHSFKRLVLSLVGKKRPQGRSLEEARRDRRCRKRIAGFRRFDRRRPSGAGLLPGWSLWLCRAHCGETEGRLEVYAYYPCTRLRGIYARSRGGRCRWGWTA
jgi:hypothetical protein